MALKKHIKLPGGNPSNLEEFAASFEITLMALDTDPQLVKDLQGDRLGNPMTLAPRVVDADTWIEDQTTAAQNKAAKWLANTLKPKKDPKTNALKAKVKYENNMRKSLDEKSWEKGIEGYDELLRQDTIAKVGTAGYSSGISNKKEKARARIKKMQPMVAALAETLDKLPIDTHEQRGQKMLAARDGMLLIKQQMRAA